MFHSQNKTENREFHKKLWRLVLPVALQNLLSAIVSASDALMLGALNQDSLSAVSLATQVQFVLNLFMWGFTTGATILAAQYWGKKDADTVEQVLVITLGVVIPTSLVFTIAACLAPGHLMAIFTNDETLIELGSRYLRIVSPSYLLTGVSQVYLCIMKNSNRTLRSTIYGSAAIVLNFVLNGVFIFGLFGLPKMAIAGAALATVIARAVELLIVLIENRTTKSVRIRWRSLIMLPCRTTDRILQKDFYRYTIPVLCNELVWGIGFTLFSVIMGHLGNDAVAANSVANIVKNIIACVCLGVGTGSGIMVGNELGNCNLRRAKEYGDRLCHMAIGTGVVSGLMILAASPFIVHFMETLTEQAHYYLQVMLIVCSYYIIGKSINSTVIAGIFCAGGDTTFGLICDTIAMWVVVIPVGLLAAFVWKMPVLWVYVLLNTDEIVKLPAVYRHYKKYHWVKDLTRDMIEKKG